MRRRLRAGVALVAGLVLSLTAPSVAAQSRRATEQYVPGLRQPVELVVDQWGVPHIYARNTDDLFLAQGFNAARDRLFQIDLWRRRGLGEADQVSKPAQRIVRVLAGLTSTDPDTARALELLRSYDGATDAGSPQAALFEPWFSRHLVPAFRRAVLPPAVADFIPVTDARLLVDALENPERWFGPGGTAVRDELLATTLAAAYREVAGRLGADPRVWKWGALQYTEFAGPGGANVGPFPRGGSAYTVDASTYDPSTYQQSSGASFKMVLDVGQWDNSRAVNAPGQSGDPRSPHYRDLAERWRSGEYFPLLYSRAQVERYAASRITLRPGGPGR